MPIKKKRKFKISNLERKSIGMTSGINASNATQLKQISQIDTSIDIPQVPMVDLYMRMKGVWHHKGKSCSKCGKMMTHPTVIDKHRYICKPINKTRGDDDAST